jgi:histidinol-phosphate aminotransferase
VSFKAVVERIRKDVEAYQSEMRSLIYLALNENPHPFPEELIQQCFESIDPSKVNLYVDSPSKEFLKELVDYLSTDSWRVREEQISVGNGADEIIYVLLLMFKDLSIYVFPPTYSCYEIFANALGVKVNKVPLRGERIDTKALKGLLNEDCVVFLPNPNNPTGHLFEDEEIFWLLSTKALLVLDEAYYEFSGKTFAPLIEQFQNLAILRTFSKAFSLASQRIGYIVANPFLIDAYNRVRLPYNVSYLGQIFATIALRNKRIFQERVRKIIEERERFKNALKNIGLKVSNSKANFVFVYLEREQTERIYRVFLKRGITVRKTEFGLRMAVGQPKQNDLLIEALEGSL